MKFFDAPLLSLQAFTEASEALVRGKGPVQLSGCVESQKVHMMSMAGNTNTRLVVTYDERAARLLLEDFKLFTRDALYFPAKDLLFYQAETRSSAIERERMRVLKRLYDEKPVTIVTTIDAMMNKLPPKEEFSGMILSLQEGSVVELQALVMRLLSLGYKRTPRVEAPGEFCVQGGILDIFDLTEELPYRLEFWDDEIDTIRTFSPESQVSINRLEEIEICPAAELFLTDKRLEDGFYQIETDYKKAIEVFKNRENYEAGASLQHLFQDVEEDVNKHMFSGILSAFLPYFYEHLHTLKSYLPKDACIFLEEPARMAEYGHLLETEFTESHLTRLEKGLSLPKQMDLSVPLKDVFAALDTERTLVLTGLDTRVSEVNVRASHMLECSSVVSYAGNFPGLVKDLKTYKKQKYSVVLLTASRTRASRIAEELREYELQAYVSDLPLEEVKPGTILLYHGNLHRGFTYPSLKYVVLTEGDIFGSEKKKKKYRKNEYDGQKIRSFSELTIGDYVVHENHGIGVYRGIENIVTEGISRDYMKITYGDSGTLYIPITNLDVVQKYASAEAKPPRLSRLDTPEWNKTKTRVKKAVEEVADELVELYAERENGTGYQFSSDTIWQREFEELFPFDETGDQLEAIEKTKQDMESSRIMDRLICGDVGFGKTEVAIRAAFKAVQDGKQVAYLVPTTILAQQHFNTFLQRMKDYPVNITSLSRFVKGKAAKDVLSGLKKGSVDIVIGTHRILSKDVEFKNLGLLIIDEEQRFGVHHKEAIKQMKRNVDVLTLTATPIPRTLHMSMIGVRDMSVLEEPPVDRLAVQTYVMEYSEELVREAVSRELARNGQVYYVYNRVSDIADVTAKVQALCPDANVQFAHGKMSERELERVMLAFVEGEIDVLVSTTIIETGLDIPNVNTIIIHDAERYGLSQLYQLRGRVGRSTRQAYAFVMYQRNRVPNEEAEKRLEAIRQFTELGSGIKIAMQDLEIRGAGTLLGNAQSGHMMEVGYDLYCKMLSLAVKEAKGEEIEDTLDTTLDVKVDAYIPSYYIGNESVKLEIYKKISLLETEEERDLLYDELVDRFSEPPRPVEFLMEAALLRARAKKVYITEIKGNKMELSFKFSKTDKLDGTGIQRLFNRTNGAIRYIAGEEPVIKWHRLNLKTADQDEILTLVRSLVDIMHEELLFQS